MEQQQLQQQQLQQQLQLQHIGKGSTATAATR